MRPRWLWSVSPAIVLGAAFAVLTRFVRRSPEAIPREISLDHSVTARVPGNWIDLSYAVDILPWAGVVLALVVCLVLARRYRQALLLLLADPLAEAINLALKIAINRQLPDQGSVLAWDRLAVLLFPSGHVVRTTVTLGLLVLFVAWPHARLRWLASAAALVFVGLVGVTQVAVGGHLPLDVVGGFLLGGTLVNLIYMVDRAWVRRRTAPRVGTVVIEVGTRGRWPAPPLSGTAMSIRSSRALPAVGLALALVVVALGVRAPQRLWHVATQPTSATTLAREWVARVHVGLRGS